MIRAILFLIALGSGGMALWLYLQRPQPEPVIEIVAPPEVEAPRHVPVLAAGAPIAAGQRVTAEQVEWIDWPANYVLPSFIFREVEPEAEVRIVERIARDSFASGEPLRWSGFQEITANPLSASLAPGMRAIAVRVTIEGTAGGFVLPNDRVDVIHTSTPRGATAAESRIIASNVRVIALDQITSRTEDANILVSRTATLELSREQVEAVAAAEQTGTLSLALRSTADEAAPPDPARPTVRIIRGGTPDSSSP